MKKNYRKKSNIILTILMFMIIQVEYSQPLLPTDPPLQKLNKPKQNKPETNNFITYSKYIFGCFIFILIGSIIQSKENSQSLLTGNSKENLLSYFAPLINLNDRNDPSKSFQHKVKLKELLNGKINFNQPVILEEINKCFMEFIKNDSFFKRKPFQGNPNEITLKIFEWLQEELFDGPHRNTTLYYKLFLLQFQSQYSNSQEYQDNSDKFKQDKKETIDLINVLFYNKFIGSYEQTSTIETIESQKKLNDSYIKEHLNNIKNFESKKNLHDLLYEITKSYYQRIENTYGDGDLLGSQ